MCALIRGAVVQFGSETLILSADVMSTTQAVGVTPNGKVTGTVREVLLDPKFAAGICADSAKFQGFVCEQTHDRNVVGALWDFVLTAGGLGSPPTPIGVARSSSGKADDYVLHLLGELPVVTRREEGLNVTRVATDGDRKFVTLLHDAWRAVRNLERWAFRAPRFRTSGSSPSRVGSVGVLQSE